MVSELEQMKSRHRQVILIEVVFGLLAVLLFIYGLVRSLLAILFAFILGGVADYFDWQRKRLERKIDTAEGVRVAERRRS
jgi:uncharacterized membrane protein